MGRAYFWRSATFSESPSSSKQPLSFIVSWLLKGLSEGSKPSILFLPLTDKAITYHPAAGWDELTHVDGIHFWASRDSTKRNRLLLIFLRFPITKHLQCATRLVLEKFVSWLQEWQGSRKIYQLDTCSAVYLGRGPLSRQLFEALRFQAMTSQGFPIPLRQWVIPRVITLPNGPFQFEYGVPRKRLSRLAP